MHNKLRLMAAFVAAAMVLPTPALAVPKHKEPDGSIRPQWDLPKPAKTTHEDIAPPSAGGDGDGVNGISFGAFDSGDMIVVLGTLTGHAGEWDGAYWTGSLYDRCVISANTSPVNGVQREQPRKYRAYDYAYGLWVPSVSGTARARARDYTRAQMSEPYVITSSKSDQTRWYCSKLCWSSYRYTASLDLDSDGGYYVWPVDLVNDSQTSVFAYGD